MKKARAITMLVAASLASLLVACGPANDPTDKTDDPAPEENVTKVDPGGDPLLPQEPMQCDCVKDKDGHFVCQNCRPVGGGTTYTPGAGNVW